MTSLTNDSYYMLPTPPCMDWRLITGSPTVTWEPWCHPENGYHTQHQNTIITLSVIRIKEILYLPRIAQFLTYEKNKTSNSVGETFSLVSDSNIQFIPRTMESHQWPIALLVGGVSGDLPSLVLECGLITIFYRFYSRQAQLPWVDMCISTSCSEDSISAPHPQFLYSFCPLLP